MAQRKKFDGKVFVLRLPPEVLTALDTASNVNFELATAYARRAIVEKLRTEGFLPVKGSTDAT